MGLTLLPIAEGMIIFLAGKVPIGGISGMGTSSKLGSKGTNDNTDSAGPSVNPREMGTTVGQVSRVHINGPGETGTVGMGPSFVPVGIGPNFVPSGTGPCIGLDGKGLCIGLGRKGLCIGPGVKGSKQRPK